MIIRAASPVFADAGTAYFGGFDPKQIKVGVGAELRLELFFFYYVAASLQLGYARGLMEGGEDQVYFLLNNPF